MTTHKLNNGYTLKTQIKPNETTQVNDLWAYAYKQGENTPEFGSCFSVNEPIEDIIAWANNHIANPPKNDFLRELEQKPFTPTHEVTEGEFKNERVVIVSSVSGLSHVKNESGDEWFTHMEWLSPINNKTTLTEQQYNNLVSTIKERLISAFGDRQGYMTGEAEIIVREWAETNNVELP